MIKNERQYKVTRAALKKLKGALVKFDSDPDLPHDRLARLTRDGVRYKMLDLQDELDEYDRLKREKIPIMEILSVDDLPRALIKSRIALGLTQRELAKRLGLKEQQIQRYEHTDYESASLSRIQEVFHVLNLEKERQDTPQPRYRREYLFERLDTAGLDHDFVTRRFVTRYMTGQNIPEEISCLQIASRVGRVFGWSSDRVLGQEPLVAKFPAGLSIPERHDTPEVRAHIGYARYIATLLSQVTSHVKEISVPSNPSEMREEILSSDFKGALEHVWRMGVPVISINLLSFQAACIRDNGKNVIILDQRDRSERRWILDLLHELHRAITNTEEIEFEAGPDNSGSQRRVDGPNADALPDHYGTGPDESMGSGTLKRVYSEQVVEESAKIQADTHGNYVLHLFKSISPLADIQMPSREIKITIRDAVLQNANFRLLAKPDLDLLRQALRID